MNHRIYDHLALISTLVASTLLFSGCGGGNSTSESLATSNSTNNIDFTQEQLALPVELQGGGIKGPLAHAIVNIYKLDPNFPGFFDSANPIATGNTDANAAIQGLVLPAGTTLPLMLEVDGSNSTDLITNTTPVLKKLHTIITRAQIASNTPVYATPLSTMTYHVAKNASRDNSIQSFTNQLPRANDIVLSAFNFGNNSRLNTFLTPPVIDNSSETVAQQRLTAEYRAANEALAAVIHSATNQLRANDSNVSEDSILSQIALDLQTDMAIDNLAGSTQLPYIVNLDTLRADPVELSIPKSTIRIRDISNVLEDELQLGNSNSTFLINGYIPSVGPASLNADIDNDGILNIADTTINGTENNIRNTTYLNPPLVLSNFSNNIGEPVTKELLAASYNSRTLSTDTDNLHRLAIVERRGQAWLQQTFSHDDGNNSVGLGRTGTQFIVPLPGNNHEEIYISFDIELAHDIEFGLGGKFGPGLLGGPETTTGGNRSDGYNGFSFRNYFAERLFGNNQFPNGTGTLYLYHVDQPNNNGENLPWFSSNGLPRMWDRGQVIQIQIRAKMNTPETSQNAGNGENDGILQVWYDGALVLDRRDIRFRHDDDIHIDHFIYSAFYGGNTPASATVKEETIWTANHAISNKPLLYNPPL